MGLSRKACRVMTRPGLRKRKSPIHTGQISRRELTSMNIASKPVLALTSLARAVAIAACGSSSKPRVSASSGGGGPEAQLLRYSECMRAHAVTGFPDPSTTRSGSNGFGIDGYNFNLPSNMNTQSPAYESAASLCGKQIGLAPAAAAATGSRRPPSWRPSSGPSACAATMCPTTQTPRSPTAASARASAAAPA